MRSATGPATQPSRAVSLLACLAAVAVLARQVFAKAFGSAAAEAMHQRAAGGGLRRGDGGGLCGPAGAAGAERRPLLCPGGVPRPGVCHGGGARESRGLWDTFRMAATDDEPPYLVTETEKGACKQAGSVPGFYTTALRENTAAVWQNALMPVVLMASIVFAGLSSLGQERGTTFAELVCHPGGRHHLCPASVLGDAILPAGPALS